MRLVALLVALAAADAAVAKADFEQGRPSPAGLAPAALAVGDLNGDGRADLVIADSQGDAVCVLLGNGDGSFHAPVTYAAGRSPQTLALGDFDNDGTTDILVANRGSGSVSLLGGAGDGTFRPQRAFPAGQATSAIVTGAFGAGGAPGLVVADESSANVSIFHGDGLRGQISGGDYRARLGGTPRAMIGADLDADGRQDLVVADGDRIDWLRGNGDGTFRSPVAVASGAVPVALAVADFNNDGIADVAVATRADRSVQILLGNGDGTLRPTLPNALALDPIALAVADFNGDGRADVIVVGNAGDGAAGPVALLRGRGDGTLEPPRAVAAAGNRFIAVATGSFRGRAPDLAVADPQAGVYTFLNLLSSDCIFADGFQTVAVPGICKPSITSANATTFKVGTFGTFTVTTGGSTPSIAIGGAALPANVSFADQGDGTGLLSGTPAAGKGGVYALTFTASNGAGSSPAQNFTLTVNEAPTITSANNASFVSTGSNNTFNITTSGWPTNASMAITRTGTLPGGISFVNNNNGTATLSGVPDAGAYLSSPYVLTIKADNGIASFASQTFTLNVLPPPPVAVDDAAYTATGGLSINISGDIGVAANDTLYGGAVASYGATTGNEHVVGEYAATSQGGAVAMLEDGTFTYQTPPGATAATDTFKYKVANAGGSSTATATVTLLDRLIFVDNTATPGGDGRLGLAYNSLASLPAAGARAPAGKKALIYVYVGSGQYGANVTLGSGDALIGQGASLAAALAVAGITLAPNTPSNNFPGLAGNPIVGASGGNVVTLGGNNLVGALTLGADGIGSTIGGVPTGTSSILGASLFCASTSPCINIIGGNGSVQFASSPLTQFSGGGAVNIGGKSGGSITFDAASTINASSATADAVVLSGNSGASVSFAGTLTLATSGPGARGFVASSGGTITVTGTGSTISTSGSSAIDIQNATIGASGVTFQSVSAANAGTGVLVSNTGSNAFTISGSGSSAGSGGTVQSCSAKGADIRNATNVTLKNMIFSGNGTANLTANTVCGDIVSGNNNGPTKCNANISLSSSTNVTLDNVSASGSKQIGIDGNALANLTLTNVSATGNGDEVGEDGVQLFNTSGTLTVSGGLFKDNAANQFEVGASTGTLAANVTGATFALTNFPLASSPNPPSPGNATANSGLYFHANSGSNANLIPTVKGSTFANIYSYALRWDAANGTSTGTVTFGQTGVGNGNTFTNDGLGIGVSSTGSGAVGYGIANNVFTNNTAATGTFNTTAVSVSFGGSGPRNGVIDGNVVGSSSAGATASGCFVSGCDGIQVTDSAATVAHGVKIINNQVFHVKGAAVRVTSSGSSTDTMRVTVANNTANYPDDATSVTAGILVQDGNTSPAGATFSCVNIVNNSIAGLWAAASSHKSAIRLLATHALQFALTNFNTGAEYVPGTVTAGCTSQCTGIVGTSGNASDFVSQQNTATITPQIAAGGSSASQNMVVGSAAWTGTSDTCL